MKKKTDFMEIKNSEKEDKHKVIILSGYSDKQINNFIEMYKLSKMPKAIFASVTQKSKEFKFKHLLKELKNENKAIKNT